MTPPGYRAVPVAHLRVRPASWERRLRPDVTGMEEVGAASSMRVTRVGGPPVNSLRQGDPCRTHVGLPRGSASGRAAARSLRNALWVGGAPEATRMGSGKVG